MERSNVISPLWLHKNLIQASGKETQLTFMSPEEAYKAFLPAFAEGALYSVFASEGKGSLAYSKLLLANAAALKPAHGCMNAKISFLSQVRSRLEKEGFINPQGMEGKVFQGNKVTVFGFGAYSGLKRLMEDKGFEAEEGSFALLGEIKEVRAVRFREAKQECAEAINSILALLNQGWEPEDIGLCCREEYLSLLKPLAALDGLCFSASEVD